MAAYVVLARRQHKPMGPVVALIVLNLVVGFAGNIDWRAHIGGLVVGSAMALAYDHAAGLRRQAHELALTISTSVCTVGVLFVLVLAITPGHVNLS
jgi:membrane associated rhomboid family serine protease